MASGNCELSDKGMPYKFDGKLGTFYADMRIFFYKNSGPETPRIW